MKRTSVQHFLLQTACIHLHCTHHRQGATNSGSLGKAETKQQLADWWDSFDTRYMRPYFSRPETDSPTFSQQGALSDESGGARQGGEGAYANPIMFPCLFSKLFASSSSPRSIPTFNSLTAHPPFPTPRSCISCIRFALLDGKAIFWMEWQATVLHAR